MTFQLSLPLILSDSSGTKKLGITITFLKYPTSFINYQHAICHHSMYASKPPQVHTHVLLKALTMTSTISFFLVLAVKQSYSVGTMIAKKLSLRLPCAYSCPKTLSASNSFLIPTDLTVILSCSTVTGDSVFKSGQTRQKTPTLPGRCPSSRAQTGGNQNPSSFT
ncbi:uncharacterized protein [Zea mays]|uniref:uncharacterized protein n=1 Tax=Zea mays TaxID=4577 RepID=UPI0004DEAF44|nr:uncharacterized protein LOC103649331 [Zea mays]|eukprot:XP_008671853.1 uncharacterized protein LOC103649331 [Zea mays]